MCKILNFVFINFPSNDPVPHYHINYVHVINSCISQAIRKYFDSKNLRHNKGAISHFTILVGTLLLLYDHPLPLTFLAWVGRDQEGQVCWSPQLQRRPVSYRGRRARQEAERQLDPSHLPSLHCDHGWELWSPAHQRRWHKEQHSSLEKTLNTKTRETVRY